MSKNQKIMLVTAVLLLAGFATWRAREQPDATTKVPFSVFMQRLEESPELFKPHTLQIHTDRGDQAEFRGQWKKNDLPYVTSGYVTEGTIERITRANIGFEVVAAPEASVWQVVLMTALPVVVLVVLFVLFMRQLQGGAGGSVMNFRNSKAKLLTEDQRKVTFADVAGIEEARGEVEEIIAFLANPKKFTRLGGRIPKGVLMMGPPGTGKTLLARAIAGEAGVPFFSISGSDFVEMFVGVGASRVRSLFEQGKRSAPCIIFVDEIDAVGRQRGAGMGGGHDEREQTLNQLLVEMDGFESNEGVIIIAATNRPDVLDPALLRPGRFDRRMVVPHPDVNGRHGILQVHTRKTPLAADVDLTVIARGTPGFVGADLSNLVNEAALLAARADKNQLDMHDFEMAKDKVLMGPERRSMVISARDKRVLAYHEAGHALTSKLTTASDPIHKVTIIPRGRAMGMTQTLPTEDRLSLTEEAAQAQIVAAMGGRVAEEIIFGQVTTGAANDLQVATALARRMVCEWGMSARIGPISLAPQEQQVFLGRDFGERGHSARTANEIDGEVRRILTESHDRARRVVLDNLEKLKLIAEALLEFETIDGGEVDRLMAGGKVSRPPLPQPRRQLPGDPSTLGPGHPALFPPAPAKA